MFKSFSLSFGSWILIVIVLLKVASFYPRWEKRYTEATISWDVFGYYLYLPAIYIYEDLLDLEFRHDIMEKYHPAGDFHHATKAENGNWVLKYAIGQSLIYFPGFLTADLISEPLGYPSDGFSIPYQISISITSLIIAFIGLFVLRKILLTFFSESVTAMTLGIIVLATNYLNYAAIDGAMTHNSLFTLYAIIVWLTIKWHKKPKISLAIWMGLAIGLATIIRPTDLMILIIPIFWGISNKKSILNKVNILWDRKLDVALLGLGILIVGMIQLGYWKFSSGNWVYYSYGDFGFDWTHPHIFDGLFSYQKGWLIYTPVMILAWLGIFPAYNRIKSIFWGLGIFMTLTIYIVFSWEVWWYGGGLGARALVQSYALLALPIASFLDWAEKSFFRLVPTVIFILACSLFNMMITYQAHAEETYWEAEYMTEAYFWKIFFNPKPDRIERKFLDVREELRNESDYNKTTLFQNNFERDSTESLSNKYSSSGNLSLELNANVQYSPIFITDMGAFDVLNDPWIRSSAKVYFLENEWDRWANTQMVIHFLREGKIICEVCETTARLQYSLAPGVWQEFKFEMRVHPDVLPGDTLEVYFWQAGGQKSIFIDDWKVELLERKQ